MWRGFDEGLRPAMMTAARAESYNLGINESKGALRLAEA